MNQSPQPPERERLKAIFKYLLSTLSIYVKIWRNTVGKNRKKSGIWREQS
jgi:hypothetical protein